MTTTILTLKERPDLLQSTLTLIENSFKYKAPYKFSEDFAPLIQTSNHHNCFLIVNEKDQVLAHIGVKERSLEGFNIALLGGIAVDENFRGEGHFQTLFQHVLVEKKDEVAFFVLWSDLQKLYKKFGFYLCGSQYEVAEKPGKKEYTQTKYHLLNDEDKVTLQHLFEASFRAHYLTPARKHSDWDEIAAIQSADLFIKRHDGGITSYFFMNKGQDLTGIIYEYGSTKDLETLINEARAYGKIWMGGKIVASEEEQFQFMLAPGDTKIFARFIEMMSQGTLKIRDINSIKQEVYFDFEDELLSLTVEEFLSGTLGPLYFEEWETRLSATKLFFSGLDSI